MKKYKEKKALHISELNDSEVERLAQDVPALNSGALKRITESCINKMGAAISAEAVSDLTRVSGTENYSKPKLIRCISTAAACAAIIISAAGVALINKNFSSSNTDLNPDDSVITNAIIAEVNSSGDHFTENNYNTATGFTETSSGNNLFSTEQNTDNAQTSEADPKEQNTDVTSEINTAEPVTQETTASAVPSEDDVFVKTKGTWFLQNGNTEIAFISMNGVGGYTIYDLNGIRLDSGTLKKIYSTATCGYNQTSYGIIFDFKNKQYSLRFDSDVDLCSIDYASSIHYSKKSDSPDEPLPQNYYHRMLGIWKNADGDKNKYITVDQNGKYFIYSNTGEILYQGFVVATELAVEPGTFDIFNTYSLAEAGLSFNFTDKDTLKSLNEEYKRVNYAPNAIYEVINQSNPAINHNNPNDYSGVYEYSAGSHDPRITITKSPDGSYKVELYIYRITCIESDEVSICDGYLAFSATDAAGDPIKGKITLTNEGCILSMTSTWPYLRGYTETPLTRTK